MIAGRSTLPRSFSARMIHLFPVPEISSGGFTKPSDQRAYLMERHKSYPNQTLHLKSSKRVTTMIQIRTVQETHKKMTKVHLFLNQVFQQGLQLP